MKHAASSRFFTYYWATMDAALAKYNLTRNSTGARPMCPSDIASNWTSARQKGHSRNLLSRDVKMSSSSEAGNRASLMFVNASPVHPAYRTTPVVVAPAIEPPLPHRVQRTNDLT